MKLKCYRIMTYFEGSHENPFHILVEDDRALLHALDVIKNSSEVHSFEVDDMNGNDLYEEISQRLYPKNQKSEQVKETEI